MNKKRILVIALMVFIFLLLLDQIITQETDTEENEVEITFEVDGTVPGQSSQFSHDYTDEELEYYPTMEEAIEKTETDMFDNRPGSREIDVWIKSFESEDTAILFYAGHSNKKNWYDIIAKFKKRTEDEKTEYALTDISPSEKTKSPLGYIWNPEKNVRGSLETSNLANVVGYTVAENGERFAWGRSRVDEVQYLEIDGQKPDEVISYEKFGETWYFWYYEDLKSDASIYDLRIEFSE